mgnify:CR=1 FL=1|jgi:hypothetical protein
MEKLNPDRFRVRKFGVSDVIVTSIGGKMQSYYVNPKELISNRRKERERTMRRYSSRNEPARTDNP